MNPWAPWDVNSMCYLSGPSSSGQSKHHYLSWHLFVCFLGSKFFGTLWASCLDFLEVYFLCQIGEVFHYFSNKFSVPCSSSSPSGTPMIRMLEHLKLSQRFLSLSSLFSNSCFFILFWLSVYFFLLVQTVDLCPRFLPITIGSLYIFLYFTLYSLHFFLYFVTILNHFYEHPDYQCFELCIL